MTEPKKKKWLISTNEERPIKEIAADLEKLGLSDYQTLEEIGCITGDAEEDDVEKLRSVPGVVDVSPDFEVTSGPPDSDLVY